MTLPESKSEKFRRLMPPRLEKAEYHIGLLSNLAAKNNYEFTHKEALAIRDRLTKAVNEVGTSFGLDTPPVQTAAPAPVAPPTPVQEPEPLPLPPSPEEGVISPPTLYDVKWSLDMLKRGDTDDAIILLTRALMGKPRKEDKCQPAKEDTTNTSQKQ